MKRDYPVAFSATVSGFGNETSIVAGVNAGQARYMVYLSMKDAGFGPRFQDIRVKRAPEYDQLAQHLREKKICMGKWYADHLMSKEGLQMTRDFVRALLPVMST